MKWPSPCEWNSFWDLKFFTVDGKENFFVIAIYVAYVKGGVFTKYPESYELRLEEDGQERICRVELNLTSGRNSSLYNVITKKNSHYTVTQRALKKENTSRNVGDCFRRTESLHKIATHYAVQIEIKKIRHLSHSKGVLISVKCSAEQILEGFFKVRADCPITPEGFEKNLPDHAARKFIKEIQQQCSSSRGPGLLVGSRSFLASINNKGEDVRGSRPVGVICDLLLFNSNAGGLLLFTVCDPVEDDEQLHAYSHTTAKALKRFLVVLGGCLEKFCIIPQVHVLHRLTQKVHRMRYPNQYQLAGNDKKVNKILESLVNVLAVVPSTLSSKMGISFFKLLTMEQFRLVHQEIDRFKELWIKGVAGTGKTVVTLEFIKELRNRDPSLRKEEILFVCENVGLKEQMSTHGVCTCLCRKGFMLKRGYTPEKVKHVIMDEVQSFRDEDRCPPEHYSWLEFARMLVRQQSEDDDDDDDVGYLWLFIDINQVNHYFPTGIPDVKKQKPSFVLTQVIRNSKENFDYAVNEFKLSSEIKIGHDFEGEEVAIETYQEREQIPKLKSVVQSILSKGYCIDDIAILYSMQREIPQDLEHELDLGKIVTAEENSSEHLVVSTFRKYSGLERPVVILVNLMGSLPFNSRPYESMYCSATRAMVKLVILNQSDN
ncbi:LOW QUALITY PROTEIN: schlafen family member 13-like [Stylophora pistillata]|uniref:LOW QUALITY PROTEIN: schlafen family member 13-like n=1 Tax=Stylophora pistillata TaxID=50429 RepID=UPI000C04C917|nr:LOW QUALITY PROTEIN: schlafen family member 13-like [Stylophora pistillata]